jgi:hypothetical protein
VARRSRKKAAAAARSARQQDLPLISSNWWTFDKTLRHVRAYFGNRDIADVDLVAAIERGDVPSKLEQMLYDPPARRSKLLELEFYQHDYKWIKHWGQPMLQSRTNQRLLGRWDIYFWGPKVEQLWPMTPSPALSPPSPPSPPTVGHGRQRSWASAWILRACPNGSWRRMQNKAILAAIKRAAEEAGEQNYPDKESTVRSARKQMLNSRN